MKRKSTVKVMVGLLVGLVFTLGVNSAFAKTYQWKMHTFVPEPVILYKGYMIPFIKTIEKRSKGQIQITPYALGGIVGPRDLLMSTAENVIQLALSSPSFDIGAVPEANALSNLPFGFETAYQAHEFWTTNKVAGDIIDKAYSAKGIKFAAALQSADPQTFLTMFPVKEMSEFKGHLICGAGYWSILIKNVGASAVVLKNLGEVYQSLEKGVFDGIFMAHTALSDFKWNEVVKDVMTPALTFGGSLEVIVNKKAFDSLTPELQRILLETAREMNATHMIPATAMVADQAVEEAKVKGVQFNELSDSELNKFRVASTNVWEYIENVNQNTKTIIDQIKMTLDAKGIKYPGEK